MHQEVRTNWLASPPLVVAYAIAGTTRIDLSQRTPSVRTPSGRTMCTCVTSGRRMKRFVADADGVPCPKTCSSASTADVFTGPEAWRAIDVSDASGTYSLGRIHLHQAAALLYAVGESHWIRLGRCRWCTRSLRFARRLGHDRPHLPGGRHSGGQSRRPLPAAARCA